MPKKKVAEVTNETNTTAAAPRRRFLAAQVGLSGDKPYAFHLEGNLTSETFATLPNVEDKPAMLVTSIGIGMDGEALMARAKGETAPEKDEPVPFVNLTFRGRLADKFLEEKPAKGLRIIVCGQLSEYTGKNGNKRITVSVDNFVLIQKEGENKRNGRFSVAPNTYVDKKTNAVVSNSMVCLLTGRVIGEPDLRQSSTSGNPFLRVGLGLSMPAKKVFDMSASNKAAESYPEDASTIMNMVFFGEDAERKAKILRKGEVIAVTGSVGEDVYNGVTRYSMIPRSLSVMHWVDAENGATADPGAADDAAPVGNEGPDFAAIGDEEDGDLIF